MEVCPACGHWVGQHFNDITGVARCLHVMRGTTGRGVIGMPFEIHCNCRDMHLPDQPDGLGEQMTFRRKTEG